MRFGYAVLISSLLASLGGCRELGSYLSPGELEACASGARTEGCPTNLEPGATVTFLEPHVLVAGTPYAPAGLGRYLELRFRVESVLDIERVDLACEGLQLASWRPQDRDVSMELEATVDLLPCRSVSTAQLVGDVELHTVPLEIRVLGPVGGQVVRSGWQVVVNLDDARVPDSRAELAVSLEAANPGVAPVGGRPVEFRAAAGDPGDPLSAAPQVWVDGVRVEDAEVRPDVEPGRYLIRLPRGLRTRHDGGGTFVELIAPRVARLTFTGVTQSGRNAVGRLSVEVERDRSDPDGEPEVRNLYLGSDRTLSVLRPVAVPAGPDGSSPGTLVVTDWSEDRRLYLFNADDTWEPITERSGNEVWALTERGQVIWQLETGIPEGILQTDLSPTAPDGPAVELPQPAFSDQAFRLGDGSVCIEDIELPTSSLCDAPLPRWRVTCLTGDATQRTVDLAALNPVNRGQSDATVGLHAGWISTQYRTPGCAPSQAVGSWNGQGLEVAFTDPSVEDMLLTDGLSVVLSAGPERAVVGAMNTDLYLSLELIDVAGGGLSQGHYFAPPASASVSPEDSVLWADADGGLVLLRSPGILERWLPGEAVPAQRFDLATWAGGEVLGPYPYHSVIGERIFELPRVVHGNGDVTIALSLVRAEELHLLTLELNRELVPVWAHAVPVFADTAASYSAMAVGLPDAPYVDVAVWGLASPASRFFRWAR